MACGGSNGETGFWNEGNGALGKRSEFQVVFPGDPENGNLDLSCP